jgi:hypothetical protein
MRSALLVLLPLALACNDDVLTNSPALPASARTAAPPASLITIPDGNGTLAIWPYTGNDFSGTPQDPINLVFGGHADPRAIRAALLALSGDRGAAGLPDVPPFNCRWTDAIGDLQTGYNAAAGWVGSAVQLACGDFGPVRIHVRLFEAGGLTLGNAHFELLIPGTTDHQVLSWELAEQLVTVDMARSGLLAGAPGTAAGINAAPGFRQIPAQIYNLLPVELKSLIGGPLGSVTAPVDIATDGNAARFELGGEAPAAAGTEQQFVIQFDQVIPRPFCASGPADVVHVQGPVELHKSVQVTPAGALTSEFLARGRLRLTPVDPATGAPRGQSYEADVKDHQIARFDDDGGQVNGVATQMELPQGVAGRGRKSVRLQVGPGGVTLFDQDVSCHR